MPQRARNRKRRLIYLLPFFTLIFLGILAVLVIKFFSYYFGQEVRMIDKEVLFYTDSKEGDLKSWGSSKWQLIPSGSSLLEGDMIRTQTGSKSVFSFYGKNFLRLQGISTMTLNVNERNSRNDSTVKLSLDNGRYFLDWNNDTGSRVEVDIGKAFLEFAEALVDIEIDPEFVTVRVLEGEVSVKLVDKETGRVRLLDRLDLLAGYQINASEPEMNILKRSLAVDLISVIEESYRQDQWYIWNRAQKMDPFAFIKSTLIATKDDKEIARSDIVKDPPLVEKAENFDLKIFSPQNNSIIDSDRLVINGTSTPTVDYIEVIVENSKGTDYYRLRQFHKGDIEFTYTADIDYGNLASGQNRFLIMATALSLKETKVAAITVEKK